LAVVLAVALLAGIGAVLAPRRDPLETFIARASHVQLNLQKKNGAHLKRLFMRVDDMALPEARTVLQQHFRPGAGWRLIKDNEFRIVYERRNGPGLEYVRAVRTVGRSGISIEEERYLAQHEALVYELRKLADRV
jgi:hypothetical protein